VRGSENPAFLAKLAKNRSPAQRKASAAGCLVASAAQAGQEDSVQ
jgi:hypothetical protein